MWLRQAFLSTYQQLNRHTDVLRLAREILADDPNNLQALVAMCVFIMRFPVPPSDVELDVAKVASGIP